MNGKQEYGDYQTPFGFAEDVCVYLKNYRHIKPSVVIEPTCGTGSFLKSSLLFGAQKYYGIEINPEYCAVCRNSIKDDRINITNSDIFDVSFRDIAKKNQSVLILGNPPWATNSALSAASSENLPLKSNFRGLKGIDAITGSSNFDICEYIILKLIDEFRNTNTLICMLCKTSVARNIFTEMKREGIAFSSCDILEFDALKIFGIHVCASILVIQLSDKAETTDVCNLLDFADYTAVRKQLKYSNGQVYKNMNLHVDDFEGHSCFQWRQGVKHDCSEIMELTIKDGKFRNGKNQNVQIETDVVFPLVKSSMFKSPMIHSFSKFVIVTQKKSREETEHLAYETPKAWKYLNDNIKRFENRKSAIYRSAPRFSMFGVGSYSYSRFKVGVSGFYKQPLFSVLYSDDGKPVMTDDTSYFICFDNFDRAYVAMLLLNSKRVQNFLMSITFLDAKRPYTKKVLERIDFEKIVAALPIEELEKTEKLLNLSNYITESMYHAFKVSLEIGQMRFA